jgi:hypothetical protein
MYAFVHIEKTGGSTLNTIFRRVFGTRHCDVRLPLARRRLDRHDQRVCVGAADLRRVRRVYRNLRGIAGHNVKPYADLSAECPGIRFVTIIRDPIARFRSHFINRAPGHTRQALDAWLALPRVHNWQTKMIAGEPSANKAIELIATGFGFVGLTERFDESLVLLAQWLDEPSIRFAYQAVNRTCDKQRPRDLSRRQSDISYLETAEVRARIQETNAEDQQVYDFVKAEIYPKQLAAYRGDLAVDLQKFQRRKNEPGQLREPIRGRLMRNYVYKPLLHCRLI